MGADLFINSIFALRRKKYEVLFEASIKRRNRLPEGDPEREEIQELASSYFDAMFAEGYFRDSYNDSNLLWKFGLSWWEDVLPMVSEADQTLSTDAAKWLLSELASREDRFETNISAISEAEMKYFRRSYEELKKFLDLAISLGEPIVCSL